MQVEVQLLPGIDDLFETGEIKKLKIGLTVMESKFTILVGDAAGIDKQIQMYCHSIGYSNVTVSASNGKVRNNIGRWDVINVKVPPNIRGFDFYATKELEMAKDADYGFMIWNGKSKGTYKIIWSTSLNTTSKYCYI